MAYKESFRGWHSLSSKVMASGDTTFDTDIISPRAPLMWNGNAIISAKSSNAAVTLSVTIRFNMGDNVGYTQWYTLYDESTTKVNTFTSTNIFTAILYNQTWFNQGNSGFQIRFTRDSGSGATTITVEGFLV